MAWNLAQALSGYQYWFGRNAPEPQEVPSPTLPEGLLPHQEDMYRELRQERINHNAAVEAGRARTAEEIGQFMAQIVNELKPDKVSHPQLKLEMPERYEGDPAEINNWLRSMETYFTLMEVTDLKRTIPITLQRITKGKGNRAGTWSAVKLKEWIDMEKEFFHQVQEKTMPADASLRNRNDGIITPEGIVYQALNNKAPFVDWIDFVEQAQEFFMTTETRDEAIRQLNGITQGYGPVEDYIIAFKALVPLSGFNDYALVAQFRQGLHPKLGYDIVRAGAPGDEDLEGWYT